MKDPRGNETHREELENEELRETYQDLQRQLLWVNCINCAFFFLLTCVYYREVNKAKAAVMAECAAKERLLDELRQRRQERLATDARANTGKKWFRGENGLCQPFPLLSFTSWFKIVTGAIERSWIFTLISTCIFCTTLIAKIENWFRSMGSVHFRNVIKN